MPDREYVYQFKMDAAQAKREAAQIVRLFNTALRQIELKPKINVGNLNAIGQQVQQTIQKQINQVQVKSATSAGGKAIDPYKAQLESAKLLRDEIRDREKEEKANLAILGQQTSELKMQEALLTKREISLRRQARDARAAALGMNPSALRGIRGAAAPGAPLGGWGGGFASGGELIPGFGQLQSMAGFTIAGVAIAELGRRTIDTTLALTEQGTALRRADFSAMKLAGSTDRLNKLMATYQQVTGASQTSGEATSALANLIAMGNADSDQELRRFLTAALGSSRGTGRTMDYVMQELQMTIANKSEKRLDQLGLSVAEVRKQEEALKGVNEEARFGEAVLTALVKKFGELVTASEAGASGLELLLARLREVREEIARNTERGLNPFFESWAVGMGSQNTQAQIRQLRRNADPMLNEGMNYMSDQMQADQTWALHRTATLMEEVDAAARQGGRGMEELRGRVQALVNDMIQSGVVTSAQVTQLEELERVYRLTANGGIVYADAMSEADRTAARLAESQANLNAQFAEAQRLLQTSYGGRMYVNLGVQGFQPEQGPQLPSDEYMRQRSIMQSGGFLTPGGMSLGDVRSGWQEQWRQQNEEDTREAIREREQAEQEAIRNNERAWKSAASDVRSAFRDAADELKRKIESIPGVMGTSQVTAEQLKMAELGVSQNFADNIRRRLEDEVLNGKDWADIDPNALFARAGIDLGLPDEAKMALFNQKWADSSLFADPANLALLDKGAIAAELERQRQSELGQSNILGAFGLGEDGEGTYFKDLGSIISGGMMTGAEEGLATFGRDALANVMVQLKSDAALQEYANLGAVQFDAMMQGWLGAAGDSDFVGGLTAVVLGQVNALLEDQP